MRPSLPISILVLLAVFFSCTIEKRVHRPGYHIEWKKRFGRVEAKEQQKSFSIAEAQPTKTQQAEVLSAGLPEKTDSLLPVSDSGISVTQAVQEASPFVQERTDEKIRLRQLLPERMKRSVIQKKERKQDLDLEGLIILIITLVVVYVMILLTCLIVGILIVDTAPIWGTVLIVIGGWMLLGPIISVVSLNRAERRKALQQPQPNDEPKTVKAFSAFSPLSRSAFPSAQQMRNGLIALSILILLYLAAMVLAIIYGILLLATEPVWGPVLLITGIVMFVWPFIVFLVLWLIDSISYSRAAKKEKREAKSAASFAESSRQGPSKSDLAGLAVIVLFLLLAYIALAVMGIIFGVSLIVMGTYFWGILLLALGSFLLLFPPIVIAITNRQDKKKAEQEAAGKAGAFGPDANGIRYFQPADYSGFLSRSRFAGMDATLAVILNILIVLAGITLMVLAIVFGISLIISGSLVWGAILLCIGGLGVLIPVFLAIHRAVRRNREREDESTIETTAFAPDQRLTKLRPVTLATKFGNFHIADDEVSPEEKRTLKEILMIILGTLAALVGIGLVVLGGSALLATFPFWGIFLLSIAGLGFAALIQWLLMLTSERMDDALAGACILTVFIIIVAAGVFAIGFTIALLVAGYAAWWLALGIAGAVLLTAIIVLLVGLSHL